jgi:hypothetical protein
MVFKYFKVKNALRSYNNAYNLHRIFSKSVFNNCHTELMNVRQPLSAIRSFACSNDSYYQKKTPIAYKSINKLYFPSKGRDLSA